MTFCRPCLHPRPLRWRDSDDGEAYLFGSVVEELMLHDIRRHVDRVAGPHFLLPDLAVPGLPLDDAFPAEYEVHFLEIGGVLDFQVSRPVFRMPVPVMWAEARAHLVHVEEEFLRGDDSPYLPRFPAEAAYVLRLDLA